ncbi:HalOD1 output domain-containing protein [Natronococcus wangiae]|uniref:HalOD1 output domain-containing protein n=1 Tax=Natronococcus wangiae TaxID=3068275 RepID=UPI00273D63AA|nr:HalOD1 output domain-containing protein [Natronococcus sp. AD5]
MTVEHEYDSRVSPHVAVIDALASLENIEPTAVDTELGIVLYDYIDPAALNSLVTSGTETNDVEISFEIDSDETYSVTITADRVTVARDG